MLFVDPMSPLQNRNYGVAMRNLGFNGQTDEADTPVSGSPRVVLSGHSRVNFCQIRQNASCDLSAADLMLARWARIFGRITVSYRQE